ncbi:hypothetical protein [Pseudochryseolinea flava]|uniref:Uncharacterized protein n=1 Tax=Pseudochryseolinea flava TaxID=2059302 RepID=A0A364XVU9_9BACT|nr:hypothetical protein [Pseudochryseolinea flava]RAV97847.1 hypothetical protein DQQ10_26645 [Pseudochryseolinea flava]
MKRNYYLMLGALICFAVAIASCGKKDAKAEEEKHDHAHDEHAEWKEMDAFHELMAASFHPYKDTMNLAPAKSLADSMKVSAEQWFNAPLPEKVNNDETKAKLQALRDGTASFADLVKSGDDKAVGDALNKLHDLFHEIQNLWYGGKGHDHHHEH